MIRTAALALLLTGSLTAFAADSSPATPDPGGVIGVGNPGPAPVREPGRLPVASPRAPAPTPPSRPSVNASYRLRDARE